MTTEQDMMAVSPQLRDVFRTLLAWSEEFGRAIEAFTSDYFKESSAEPGVRRMFSASLMHILGELLGVRALYLSTHASDAALTDAWVDSRLAKENPLYDIALGLIEQADLALPTMLEHELKAADVPVEDVRGHHVTALQLIGLRYLKRSFALVAELVPQAPQAQGKPQA